MLSTGPNHKVHERRLYGLFGVLGVLMLGVSFAINQGPPAGANDSELHAFAVRSFREVMLAGWLQAVGPALLAAFVFGVVGGLSARGAWLASMTRFGMTILMMVSLGEVSLYFAALFPLPDQMSLLSLNLIRAVQHLYFILAAPAVFLPFGFALRQLGFRLLGWSAVGLGALFAIIGCVTIFAQVLPNPVTVLGAVQALWWLAASVVIGFVTPRSIPEMETEMR